MQIECLVDRPEPVEVAIGNEKYAFVEDEQGRKVCEVWIENHIECFLAVSHLYREAVDLKAAQRAYNDQANVDLTRREAKVRPGVDDMKRPALMAELKERGVSFDIRCKNEELRDILTAARCR